MNLSENPRWKRIQDRRDLQEKEAKLAEKCKQVKFVDDQIRTLLSVPTDLLDKFQFIGR